MTIFRLVFTLLYFTVTELEDHEGILFILVDELKFFETIQCYSV